MILQCKRNKPVKDQSMLSAERAQAYGVLGSTYRFISHRLVDSPSVSKLDVSSEDLRLND